MDFSEITYMFFFCPAYTSLAPVMSASKGTKIFMRQNFFASQMTFFVYFCDKKKVYENRIGKMYERT
jgi:hypothetical protein